MNPPPPTVVPVVVVGAFEWWWLFQTVPLLFETAKKYKQTVVKYAFFTVFKNEFSLFFLFVFFVCVVCFCSYARTTTEWPQGYFSLFFQILKTIPSFLSSLLLFRGFGPSCMNF